MEPTKILDNEVNTGRGMLKWVHDSKVRKEEAVFYKLEKLCKRGPTAILLVGADGALKSAVVGKLWQLLDNVVPIHPYGEPDYDLAQGKIVVNNPFGLDVVNQATRDKLIKQFLDAGAENMVEIWVKYPDEDGWTNSSGRTVDQILRDNPPEDAGVTLLLEVEKT